MMLYVNFMLKQNATQCHKVMLVYLLKIVHLCVYIYFSCRSDQPTVIITNETIVKETIVKYLDLHSLQCAIYE